jgi:hypothetical protein
MEALLEGRRFCEFNILQGQILSIHRCKPYAERNLFIFEDDCESSEAKEEDSLP